MRERIRLSRRPMTAASEVFAGLPAARRDGADLRASIRAMRAADGVLVGVLDDDPTGSQSVHGVQVVTVPEEGAYAAALAGPAAACFGLTNTRSLDERAAARLSARGPGPGSSRSARTSSRAMLPSAMRRQT